MLVPAQLSRKELHGLTTHTDQVVLTNKDGKTFNLQGIGSPVLEDKGLETIERDGRRWWGQMAIELKDGSSLPVLGLAQAKGTAIVLFTTTPVSAIERYLDDKKVYLGVVSVSSADSNDVPPPEPPAVLLLFRYKGPQEDLTITVPGARKIPVTQAVSAVVADEPGLKPGDVVSTTEDGLPFGTHDTTCADLPIGTELTVTAISGTRVGGYVTLQGTKYLGWIPVSKLKRSPPGASEAGPVNASEMNAKKTGPAKAGGGDAPADNLGLKPGDVVSTTEDGLPFGTRDTTCADLPIGTELTVTAIAGTWVGGYVTLQGTKYLGWIQ